MTLHPLMNTHCDYQNDGTTITQPGKFEGEPVWVPTLWNNCLEGFHNGEVGDAYKFVVSEEVDGGEWYWPAMKKWLGRKRTVYLREDSQGFVHAFTR